MPEKELANGSQVWFDPNFWILISILLMGYLARTLASEEPFDKKRFFAESILTVIGGVLLYAAGLIQGLSFLEMVVFYCLTALGGVRTAEWVIKAVVAIKKANIQ